MSTKPAKKFQDFPDLAHRALAEVAEAGEEEL